MYNEYNKRMKPRHLTSQEESKGSTAANQKEEKGTDTKGEGDVPSKDEATVAKQQEEEDKQVCVSEIRLMNGCVLSFNHVYPTSGKECR